MEYTKHLIKQVSDIVSPVYLVGGSVRDLILGKTPHDFDFTTPLSPDDVEAAIKLAGRHVYAIGKKYGTLGFKIPDMNGVFQMVEVTTFREERYNQGSRKPEVNFVDDLQSDLSRRDFTINAISLAVTPDGDDNFFDPYGGRLDIISKKIKAVGKATDRFKEDPLRMLRAARFAAQLGFGVDPNMIGFIRKLAHTICSISRERWVQEMDKLLVAPNLADGLDILYTTRLMRYMLPELEQVYNSSYLYLELLRELEDAPNEPDARWAVLLRSLGRPITSTEDIMSDLFANYPHEEIVGLEMARGICLRLKFSNDRQKEVAEIYENKKKWEQKYAPSSEISIEPSI